MSPSVASPDVSRSAPWWVRAFSSGYLTVYGHRDDGEAARNVSGIARLLDLAPHARVLDLACGEGRYCRALSARGFQVTGVDLSDDLLAEARRRSPLLPGMPTYVRADMRSLPFGPQFDAVVSLFTSFGYFDERADDARVLSGVARVLVPGGRFLLDFLNAEHVRRHLVTESVEDRAPHRVMTSRRIDDTSEGGPYVRKSVVVVDPRVDRIVFDAEERVRLYEPGMIDAMLRTAELEPVGAPVGDFEGAPWTPSSPRWIRVARKVRGARR
jgi:SAM-dependent methyltransferase